MRKRILTAMVFLGTVFTTGSAIAVDAENTIRIGGGGAAMSTIFVPVSEAFFDEKRITLITKPTDPIQGLVELDNNEVDVTTGLFPLDEMLTKTTALGMKINNAPAMKQVSMGDIRLVVFIHRTNPVASLTKEQLKGIFSGKIKNWKAVGGEDRSIVVIWGNTPGQNARFRREIMDSEPLVKEYLDASNYADIRLKVKSIPGAIGIDPEGFKSFIVKSPQTPKLTATVYSITKGEPSPKVKQLYDYIREVDFTR